MKLFSIFSLILSLFVLFGCSTNENPPLEPEPPIEPITITVSYGESYYINLAEKSVVEITDPLLENGWDIVIDLLTRIKLNGGASSPGPVYASKVEGLGFEDVKTAPSVTYMTDDQNGDYIGENWYFYDLTTHSVTPYDQFYIIRDVNDEFYKFKISDVVVTSRTEIDLKIYIEKISSPASYETQSEIGRSLITEIDLSTLESVYFDLKEVKIIEVSDESTSMDWDLKTSYLTVNLNGGTSGPGNCMAVMYEDVKFDSLHAIPADGYVSDDSTSSLAIGNSWYSYNPATHTLSPVPNVYVIKTNDGHHAKLEFIAKDFPTQAEGVAIVKLHYTENVSEF